MKNIIGKISKPVILLAGLAAIASACSDECLAPVKKELGQESVYKPISVQEETGLSTEYEFGADGKMLYESCPDGCSYDSDKGCCWCPD